MASPSDFSVRSAFAQMHPHLLAMSKLSKAPQHNPYDKFTQDEFNAWIGGITSALKRALGQENGVVSPPEISSQYPEQLYSSDEEEVERLVEFTGESSDAEAEEAEESFSYSTARRVSKGKARDPRDGPGFGKGDQSEPIFIGSDSEDEEEDGDDEVIEEGNSQSEEDDEKRNIDWAEAESSVQARIRREKQTVVEVTEENDPENEEVDEEEDVEEGGFEGDEQQGEDDKNDHEVPSPRQTSFLVLVVDSDEEDEVNDMASQGRAPDETVSAVERFNENDTAFPLSTSIRVGPPRYRAKQRPASPVKTTNTILENYDDIQRLENDTSFPPHETVPPPNEDRPIELPDRWVGPGIYAEDYYSGGDVRESPNLNAGSLGMEHEEPQQATVSEDPPLEQHRPVERHNEVPQAQDVLDVDEVDGIQPLSNDTSFPPKTAEDNHFQSHQPIEIPDPWVGPKTYAEDFYYGGDVRPLQNGTLNPHRLGDNDESVVSTPIPQHKVVQPREEVSHVDETDQSEGQPPSKLDAVMSSNTVYESPQLDYTVELPEPWDEPISYEDDYSAEVEVKPSPQMITNQSGVGNDTDAPMTLDFENETGPVKPQDVTVGTSDDIVKLIPEHCEESAERVLNPMEPLATSGSEDSSRQSDPAQPEDFNVLYDDQNQYDVPVLEWINDSAFIHDIPTGTIVDMEQPNFDASTSASIRVDSNEKALEEIAEKTAENINVPALETQLPIVEVSIEQTAEVVGQVLNECHSEAGLQNAPEVFEGGTLPLPSASLGPTEVIEDASLVKHDQESEIKTLPTLARNETETGEIDRFIDFALKEDLVAPEIKEVEETDFKVDVNIDEIPLLDTVPETQDITVKYTEVLDGDSTTPIDTAPKTEIGEPVTVIADLDKSGLTLPEPGPIVSSSAIPTMTERLQSVSGHANPSTSVDTGELDSQITPQLAPPSQGNSLQASIDTGELDSQIAPQIVPPSQDNLLQASEDLSVHKSSTSISQPQPLDSTVDSESSFDIIEPLQATSEPAPDLAITPPVSETSQIEAIPEEHSLTTQLQFPVNSDMIFAPMDYQKVQLPSKLSTLRTSMNVVMRKASEPILFADPYPASLSTPDDADRDYAMSYEDFFRQNFSPSHYVPEGSTAGRNVVNGRIQNQTPADNSARDTYVQPNHETPLQRDNLIKVELASDTVFTLAEPAVTALSSSPTFKNSVADNTALYVQPNDEALLLQQDSTKVELINDADLTLARPVATALPSSPTSRDFDKSLELDEPPNSTSMVSESAAKDDGDGNTVQDPSPLSSPVVERAIVASTTRVRSPPLEDDLPSILIIKKVHADDQTPVKFKARRPQKRKRSSSVIMTPPSPRTGSSKKSEKNKAVVHIPAKSRGPNRKASKMEKGKGKEVGIPPTSQGSFDTQSISSRSSSDASAARRMLEPSSRGTSRASSIASTAPSDNSMSITQPSPTLGKGSSFRQQPLPPLPPPPIPLLHRHHHNRSQPPRPVPTQRASLSARQHDSASAEISTSKQSSSSLHRHPTYSSSPVTRSNCRYHKISIPLDDESDEESSGDEDVKLVYFLVPGCSLGNKELNRDEKIVDHGDAQPSDGLLMTSDLDAYAFNAPLLSVLRLLVGVDMLREGEIYYLPLPGSDWVPRKVRDASTKAHQSSVDHVPSHVTHRRNSNISTSPVVNAPVSANGSASTLAPSRSMKPSSIISQTSSELTEVEDSPQSKRFKSSPAEDNARELELESDPRLRKLKHLGQDAAEHRPNSQDEDDDLYDHVIGRARSNKGNKHGLKRSRTSDVIRDSDVDGQKLKKQKTAADLRAT